MADNRKLVRFLNNLNEEAVHQLAKQLLIDPNCRPFIVECAEEFDKAFGLGNKEIIH